MPSPNSPFYPIIYVRGYAMTEREQDETTADPFCGFNLGSTVYRATSDKNKPAKKFIFESPVLRLTTDYSYSDSYHNGLDILDPDWEGTIPPRSVVIYRYYDQASRLLGTGKTPDITEFAKGLSQLILRVRDLVCSHPNGGFTLNDFRCYLRNIFKKSDHMRHGDRHGHILDRRDAQLQRLFVVSSQLLLRHFLGSPITPLAEKPKCRKIQQPACERAIRCVGFLSS